MLYIRNYGHNLKMLNIENNYHANLRSNYIKFPKDLKIEIF